MKNIKIFVSIFVISIIVASLSVGVYLIKQSKEIKEGEAGSCDSYSRPMACVTCYGEPGSTHTVGYVTYNKGSCSSCCGDPL